MALTREEALLAAEVAEKYPPGIRTSAWGYNGGFYRWHNTPALIKRLGSDPALAEFG